MTCLRIPLLCLAGALLGAGCQYAPQTKAERLQELLDEIVRHDPSVPGVALSVRGQDFEFDGAAGLADFGGEQMTPHAVFRTASVTKTFTAAAALVLVERGELMLDDVIADLLGAESIGALRDGGYDPDAITLRQLLAHTACIFDYTETDEFYRVIEDDPSRVWTRNEQLLVAMEYGAPLCDPGDEYHYGDTHYILAGEIVERATGLSLGAAFRDLLDYDGLGLAHTWLETLEPQPFEGAEQELTHPYIGDVDTREWHPSWDLYGGGGIVSNTSDLARFGLALHDTSGDGIFESAETLETMLAVTPVARNAFYGLGGALGLARFPLDGGSACSAGFGYFSTVLVVCPDEGFAYAATLNQAEPEDEDALLDGVLEILLE